MSGYLGDLGCSWTRDGIEGCPNEKVRGSPFCADHAPRSQSPSPSTTTESTPRKPGAWSPKRECSKPGCNTLVQGVVRGRVVTRCPLHPSDTHARGEYRPKGVTRRQWETGRDAFLREHPYCESEKHKGMHVEATVADHDTPHRNDINLFWPDAANVVNKWVALCHSCHSIKTVKYDSGFGNLSGR
jgi:5-methylcytosine-specific restriction protein A